MDPVSIRVSSKGGACSSFAGSLAGTRSPRSRPAYCRLDWTLSACSFRRTHWCTRWSCRHHCLTRRCNGF